MTLAYVLNQKKEKNTTIKDNFGLIKKYKPLGLIELSDMNVLTGLIEGLKVLPADFVIVHSDLSDEHIFENVFTTSSISLDMLVGFDFVVGDDNIENINNYSSKGVTPIIKRDNHLSSILKEFNPMKYEGNSFFYEEDNIWSIYGGIVKYMENYKFPFDNKNLVKNVLKI